MNTPLPHYLLFCDGNFPSAENATSVGMSKSSGRWKFVLEQIESGEKFEATDREAGATPDRTALIAVLRGLEALEQPSRVTLVTTSRYVFRGLQYGLAEWRENNYSWEHFGSVQPIRNADIWRRIDRTLAFHKVQCRWISQDQPDYDEQKPVGQSIEQGNLDSATPGASELEQVDAPTIMATVDSEAKVEQVPTIFRDSGATISRVFDTSRTSHTVATNYVIAEVEKKGDTESELSIKLTPESNASTNISRFDFPVDTARDSAEPSESCQKPIGPPPPMFLRKLSSLRGKAWRALLRLDEEIEGYFRCLLLMEPRPPRRDS